MNDMTALRLYFPQCSHAQATRFRHRLAAPALSYSLLTAARQAGIRHALPCPVQAGYLPDSTLTPQYPQTASAQHAQCIELIDVDSHLRQFLREHADKLHGVRAVFSAATTSRTFGNCYPTSALGRSR